MTAIWQNKCSAMLFGQSKIGKVISKEWLGGQHSLRLLLLALLFMEPVTAERELLPTELVVQLGRHERVLAAEKDVAVAMEAKRSAYAGYLPTVSATLYQGTEKIKNTDGSRTSMGIHEQGINVVQSLYDFGETDAQVEMADLGIRRAELALRFVQESLLMEGVSAYLGLEKSSGRVDYALQSEKNIKKQTGMEESLVETGAGIPSDVLQTKAQLTGTQALRVQEEGMNRLAESRYWAVFGVSPQEKPGYRVPEPSLSRMPTTLDQALRLSDEHSAEVKMGKIDIEIARSTVKNQKASALPKLSFNIDYKQKHNVSGSAGDKTEGLAKVELSWPIYSGGSEQSAIDSSIHAQRAAELRLEDTRKRVHEAVRIAWHNWKTAKETASLLKNQSNIAFEFLEQARVERKLGSRTLQDVLTGETTYLTAISNAVSAEIDYKIAAYQLLNAVGQLKQQGVDLPESDLFEQKPEELRSQEDLNAEAQQVESESEDSLSRVVGRVVDRMNSIVSVPLNPEISATIPKEAAPLAPTMDNTPLALEKRQTQNEIDRTIYLNRSAYHESIKEVQVSPVTEPNQPASIELKEKVSIVGSRASEIMQSENLGHKADSDGSGTLSEDTFKGIWLVGPGGVGRQQKLERLKSQAEPQWIELR